MKKITHLTQAQKDKFSEYVDKYANLGLSTERVDFEKAKKFSDYYYEKIAKKKVSPVVVLRSPIEAWIAVCKFHDQVYDQVSSQVYGQVSSQVDAQVDAKVRAQVGAQVRAKVYDQAKKLKLLLFIWPHIDGHWWSNYFAFYDFMYNELGVTGYCDQYTWLHSSLDIGLFYPLDNICIISDRPSTIKRNKTGLHCETGKALEYPDGWGFYSLNGIVVPEWIVKTPSENITIEQMLKIENVGVRRECLRKMGIDRLVNHGVSVDKKDGYELIDLGKFFLSRNNFYAPYLVMKNPSIDVWHVEGVHEDCKTVEQALNWRYGTTDRPKILT